jgi:hypothetical protein
MLLLFLLLLFTVAGKAQNYTISGYITDKDTGEPLISASVFDTQSLKGASANNYGFYSLTLPRGEVSVNYSYIGYQTENRLFSLQGDTIIHIRLSLQNMLNEVTVVGYTSETGVKGSQMSAVEVPISQIKSIPTLFGENDLIKALQLLPGVQAGTEGSAGFYVRGGGPDENLLLLDGVPLYNVNHMFGFFSVFNSDALKNVTLYKGSFPARFGGRLSSVVDVRMKDGDDKKIKGSASIGVISSKIQVEGPIIKERTTFNVSARRTYIDILAQPFIKYYAKQEDESNRVGAGYYFYDINAKFTHRISERDKLFLSVYTGDDAMYARVRTHYKDDPSFEEKYWTKLNWGWGNLLTALRWNRVVSSKLFMNTTASFTRYRSKLRVGEESQETDKTAQNSVFSETNVRYNSGISDRTIKTDFDYNPGAAHDVKFGVNYTYHTFSPDVSSYKFSSTDNDWEDVDTVIGSPKVYAHETMAYIEDNISLGKIFKLNLGAHLSSFHVQGENYFSLQPRAGLRALLDDNLSVKAGYAYMEQYVHMLSNSSVSLPTDLWVPVTKKIRPMSSHQYSAGLFYSLRDIAGLSVEGYYKTMDNLLEYKDGASFLGVSTQWEDKVSMGRGTAYGIEFLMQRMLGNTTGWLGYTWSRSDRIFNKPGNIINNGRAFPAKYDRRHDLSLTLAHRFSEKFDIAGSWVFSTGNAGTFGYQEYINVPAPNFINPYQAPSTTTHIENRNNFRFANYHRLDLGVNFHKTTKRGNRSTWNISVYNAYNQHNPFMVYASAEGEYNPNTGQTLQKNKLMQASLFPIIPSVSYTLSF